MSLPGGRGSRAALAIWLAGVLASIFVITRTPFSADLSAFLPSSPTPAQQILVEQLRDGVVSRLLLVGLDGGDPAALAATSKKMAAILQKDPLFAAVNNGEEQGLTPDREFFWKNRYLLSPGTGEPNHFTAVGLRQALDEDIQLLGSPAGALIRQILPNDPTGELLRLIDQFEGGSRPLNQEGVWFSHDGKRALLMAQTRAAGYDIDAQEVAQGHIRAAFAEATRDASARQSLVLTGPGVFAAATRSSIKDDAWRLSMIATILVALLMLMLYRSPRVLVLAFFPVATGALAGIAAVSLVHGAVHGITLGFGVTLIGEGVDYAIYLFTQIAPGSNAREALKRLWPTLRLGVLTSICGFSALLLSGFPGLAQLGLFSIVGLIVAAAVTRYVLPALLPEGFAARSVDHLAPGILRVVDRFILLRIPFYALTAGALVWLSVIGGPPWSDELSSLSPVPLAEQKLDEQMRRDMGAPDVRYLIVSGGRDAQAALEAAEALNGPLARLVEAGALEGYDSPAQVLPSLAVQKRRQSVLPEPSALEAALKQGQEGTPFKPGAFDPFLKDVEAARGQALLTRENMGGGALALKLDSLLIRRPNGTWAALMPLRGVQKPGAITQALAGHQGDAMLLDIKRDADQMFSTYRREAESHTLWGAVAIAVLLFISMRSGRRVFDVLAPLAAAVLVTTCVLVLIGEKLTIFHLVGLSLVVAVGSNYSLFFEKVSAAANSRERTIVSLLFANAAMVIAFGLLGSSKVPVLAAIGLTVAIGAVLSLVFSAILARK